MAVAVPFQGKFEREVKKMATINEIAAKYGHEMQNDANLSVANESLRKKAQAAIDNLYKAAMKAKVLVSDYNKALSSNPANAKIMVDFHDVLNNLKSGANTRI